MDVVIEGVVVICLASSALDCVIYVILVDVVVEVLFS